MRQKMKKVFTLTLALFMLAGQTSSASAAQMGITLSKSTNLGEQESIMISVTNFPTKAGIYLQQCVEPLPGARAASCNRLSQLWITNSPGGSFKPTDTFPMSIISRYENVDCTIQKCGVSARYDRTAGDDTSEDQFVPLFFSAGFQSSPSSTPTPLAEQKVAKLISSMKNKARIALPIQTDKGINLTYRSATPKICTLKANVITAKKSGLCKLQLFAPANSDTAMLAQNISIRVR
jgi:hypothetical protein